MPKGRIHQSLWRHAAIFRQQRLFQGPAVDPDADGDMFPGAGHGHGLHPVFPADVAGVDADLIRPGLDALQRQTIVKVNVHHQGQVDLFLDGPHGLGRRHVRHSHPDDLAPRRSQAANLGHGRLYVAGGGVRTWIGWSQERPRPRARPRLKFVSSCSYVTNFQISLKVTTTMQQNAAGQSLPHGSMPHTSGPVSARRAAATPPPRSAGRCARHPGQAGAGGS